MTASSLRLCVRSDNRYFCAAKGDFGTKWQKNVAIAKTAHDVVYNLNEATSSSDFSIQIRPPLAGVGL